MTDSRTPAVALLSLVAVLVALPVAGAAAADGGATAAGDAGVQANNSSSMGAEISAFMQSSASEADGSVEDGMFEARYDNGSDRAALVRNRTDRLRSELDRLRAEKRALRAEKGNMSRLEYQARMSRLVGEVRSLERSANRTEPLAESAGVNRSALAEIRANASAMSGQEVSALARTLAVVPDHVERGPPGNRTAGPPDDRGGAGNGPGADGNGTRGPPDDRGSDGEGAGGPPDDRGAGRDDGTGQNGTADGGDDVDGGDDGDGSDGGNGSGGNGGERGNGNGGGPAAASEPLR
ncbi:hypothetical protein [Halostella litorea]|uniref:hypothetical protein n=1 Tax=Halostella litorea TaxID=2528831 RepID=UPI001091B9C6|nr:hypothetical protein [Halostella litorea]